MSTAVQSFDAWREQRDGAATALADTYRSLGQQGGVQGFALDLASSADQKRAADAHAARDKRLQDAWKHDADQPNLTAEHPWNEERRERERKRREEEVEITRKKAAEAGQVDAASRARDARDARVRDAWKGDR